MKNNILVIVLVVIIGVLSGIGLLLGISNAVSMSVSPMVSEVVKISTKLEVIEQKIDALEKKIGSAAAARPTPPQPPQEDFDKVYAIDAGKSPILGPKEAPVTIVEFTDLQCPFCARFHPVINEVLKAYPNDVRLIIKNFPLNFHPNARPAAKLAFAADLQGKYFEMVEQLLQNGAQVSEEKVQEYAKALNLNYDQLMADYKNKDAEWEARIQEDMKLGMQVDVRGTPSYYVNGRKTMARDLAAYKAQIDKILAEKK